MFILALQKLERAEMYILNFNKKLQNGYET